MRRIIINKDTYSILANTGFFSSSIFGTNHIGTISQYTTVILLQRCIHLRLTTSINYEFRLCPMCIQEGDLNNRRCGSRPRVRACTSTVDVLLL